MVELPTEAEAQEIHDARRTSDPEHDQGSCWCCCIDCGFDVRAVMERGAPITEGETNGDR